MKSVSSGMAAHIQGESVTLATLWRIERQDGTVFRFTDHDRDIVYGGDTYLAALGYQRAAVSGGSGLEVDGTEIAGMVAVGSADYAEIRAGLWDYAEVRLWAVNWADLTQGEIKLKRGSIGEMTVDDRGLWRAEFRSLAQPLQATIGGLYQAECRADLGDARCGVDLTLGGGFTAADTIATVTDATTLILAGTGTSLLGDGWFDGGVVIWQTGANAGVSREVVGWTQGTLTLLLLAPPPFAPEAGDDLHIQSGCDKRGATCRSKFNNYLNFRGEEYVPGAQAILATPA